MVWPWHVAVQGCWRASGTSCDEIDANGVQGGRADNLCAGKAREERRAYREPNTKRVEREWSDASDEEGISARGGGVNITIFKNHFACKLYRTSRDCRMHESHTCIATPSSGPKRQCISKAGRLSQGSSPPEAMSIYIQEEDTLQYHTQMQS